MSQKIADQLTVSWFTSEISRFSGPFYRSYSRKRKTFYIGWPISTVENNQFLGFNARPVFSLVAEHINKN